MENYLLYGVAAAGPLYGAFPVAAVFIWKSALGAKFAVTRMLVDIPGIILIGYVLNKIVSDKEKEQFYEGIKELAA